MKSSRKTAGVTSTLPERPTIAVVGLRYGQAEEVVSRCGRVAKLKFVNADQSETVLPECDAVFVLTRFAKPRWTAESYRTLPRRRVHLHGGGISTLADRILSLAATALLA